MAWPPTTHQDVQDEVTTLRLAQRDYFRPGHYNIGTITGIGFTSVTMPIGTSYARPFWVGAKRAFDRIGINVLTASAAGSGGLIQLGLFEPGAGLPGPLVFETGTVSSETSGAKEFVISATLDPGIWWVAVRVVAAGCAVPMLASPDHNTFFISGSTTPPGINFMWGGLSASVNGTVAGLPANTAYATVTSAAPSVCLRAA